MEGPWYRRGFAGVVAVAIVAIGLVDRVWSEDPKAAPKPISAPGMYRDRFESGKLAWHREETDAAVQIEAHEWTDQVAREGKGSERIKFIAGLGSQLYYSHDLPRIPIDPKLELSIYARSTREGARIQARVVLPEDIDPDTHEPSFVIISGAAIDTIDHWQKLILDEIPLKVSRQARTLRIATKRPVSLQGAYVDRMIMNLYSGDGATEVCLDDLSVYPVPADVLDKLAAEAAAANAKPGEKDKLQPALAKVSLTDNVFRLDGKPWVFSIIDAPGARLLPLRQAGFDALAVAGNEDPDRIEDALRHGFLLMPSMADPNQPDPAALFDRIKRFPGAESVAFWNLGSGLGAEFDPSARDAQRNAIRDVVGKLRLAPPAGSRLTTALVEGMLNDYTRPPKNLDLVGIDLKSWGRQQDPLESYTYIKQRLDQSFENPNALFWALIDATPNPAFQTAIWGDANPPDWGVPRVQADQLRIWTYLALAAGCRGIGFRGDAGLTGPQEVGLRTEMSFLNLEISLFRALLAQAKRPGPMIPVFPPDPLSIASKPVGGNIIIRERKPLEAVALPTIKAASFQSPDKRTLLLLIYDISPGAQWQPPQSASSDIRVIVPALEGSECYEVSPAGVQKLKRSREPGGVQILLPEFGVATMVVVTTDPTLAPRIEAQVDRNRALAVSMAIEQAKLQIDWVTECDDRLRGVWENTLPPILKAPVDEKERKRRIEYRTRSIELVAEARGYLGKGRTDVARRKAYEAKDLDVSFEPLEDSPDRVIVDADAVEYIGKARDLLAEAQDELEAFNYLKAWSAARRVGRPLRILMREHFERGVKGMLDVIVGPMPATPSSKAYLVPDPDQLVSPVSSPPLVSFNTLPQHWLWVDKMRDWRFGPNLLADGNFENPQLLDDSEWHIENHFYDGIDARVDVIARQRPKSSGKRVLRLNVGPIFPEGIAKSPLDNKYTKEKAVEEKNKRMNDVVDRLSPFLDQPAAGIRTPEIKVKANQLVKISLWVKKPLTNLGGAGGLIVRDSLGGEPLQYRTAAGIRDWKQIVLFRRVPADRTFHVFIGLAGYGVAEIDDLKVELGVGETPGGGRAPSRRTPIARTPRPAERPIQTTRSPKPVAPRAR